MSTRTRRWLIIAACLGIPIAIVVTGTRSFDPSSQVDPAYPPKCDAIYRQVESAAGEKPADSAATAAKAAEAAAALATSSDSTREEQICGRAALTALTRHNVIAPSPPADLSTADRCVVAATLGRHGATQAAISAYDLLRATGTAKEKRCGALGVARLAGPSPPPAPQCVVAARLLATGPEKNATDAMTKAVGSADTSAPDAVCVIRVIGAVAELNGAAPPTLPAVRELKPAFPKLCHDAVAAARTGDLGLARADYRKQLRASRGPSSQACAVGGLARLPEQHSFADWTFVQANRVADWATSRLPGGPIVFGSGSKTTVIAVFWFVTLGLVLVAARQLIRWRRERVVGPVEIKAVDLPDTENEAVDVADTMREHLSRAGIYQHPFTTGLGEVLIDATAALAAIGDTGAVGKVFNALKDAIAIKTGYVVTATPDHDPDAAKESAYRLIVQIDNVATGATICTELFEAASYRDAAETAAYGVYMRLSDEVEVRRRTPSFLRWNSCDGLQQYHSALQDKKRGSFVTAVETLEKVAKSEPANLQVQSELAHGYLTLARGSPEDNVLRDASEIGVQYLQALTASLRAVLLNPFSDDAHSRLAWILGYVAQWKDSWATFNNGEAMVRLLALTKDAPDSSVLATPQSVEFKQHFLARSDQHWRLAARRTWWPMACWVALALNRRRTVAGRVWPFRRLRKSIHDIILGADVATRYDRFTAAGAATPGIGRRALLELHLLRVRFGRVLWLRRKSAKEDFVLYNLSAAYVRRANWLDSRGAPYSILAASCRRYALRALGRSYRGAGRQMPSGELEFIMSDPDFDMLLGTPQFERWHARFPTDTRVVIARKAWSEQFATVAKKAEAASRSWNDHLAQALPSSGTWNGDVTTWVEHAVSWMGDDLARWSALKGWAGKVASTARRRTFEKAIEGIELNNSRPIASIADPSLPDGSAASAEGVRAIDKPLFERLAGFAEQAERNVRADLEETLGLVAARDLWQLREQFRANAAGYAAAWASIATYAQKPL